MPVIVVPSSTPTATVVAPSITTASVITSDSLSPSDIPTLVSHRHTQTVAFDTWTITHNLNFYPNVTVLDSGGNMVEGAITYIDSNNLTLTFSAAISGVANLS